MRIVTLIFHDVVTPCNNSKSGFIGPSADWYKLSCNKFNEHLENLPFNRVTTIDTISLRDSTNMNFLPVLLTFDDGGVSAHDYIADTLEKRGFKGHFFIVTSQLNKNGFLKKHQLRDLKQRGHLIGTHSVSHSIPFSKLPTKTMLLEWKDSRHELEDILGEKILCGSVPGGFFSDDVARTARDSGLKILFTSEPKMICKKMGGLFLIGRFSVTKGTKLKEISSLCYDIKLATARRWISWNIKKAAKFTTGSFYLYLRRKLLSGRSNK